MLEIPENLRGGETNVKSNTQAAAQDQLDQARGRGVQARADQEQQHDHWGRLMGSGYTVRNIKPLKLEPFDTLGVVTDDGLLEEWQGGKVVARGVTQEWIDSNQWGGTRL